MNTEVSWWPTRRGGPTCSIITRCTVVSGIPACAMYSTSSGPVAVISYTSLPPGRISISCTATLNPSGPHHDSIPSRVVHSSQTSSIDASNVRSMVSLGRTCIRLLQFVDVELLHLEHGLQRRRRVARPGVGQQPAEHVGHDLPADAEAVLQPSALALFPAACDEPSPVAVDLLLRVAVDHEREAFREFERLPAVEGGELPAVEHELGAEHLAPCDGSAVLFVALNAHDLRVGEDRDVEVDRLLGAVDENEAWSDHGRFSFLFLILRRRSSSAPILSRRPSHMTRYAQTNCDSSSNGSGRSADTLREPSGRPTTKLASPRTCSCGETPRC